MIDKPLAGLNIVITRPAGTGHALAARLRELGAAVLHFPAIVIEPQPLSSLSRCLLDELASFDFAIFISPSAVTRLFAVFRHRWPAHTRPAAVGEATARALRYEVLADVLEPPVGAGAGAEALLALPAFADLTGRRVLIFGGEGGRPELAAELIQRGASVEKIALYRRAPPADLGSLRFWLDTHAPAALIVTSVTALNHLESVGADAQLVAPSPRVVKHAGLLGYKHIIQAADAGDAALIAALIDHWKRA
ncbi:MAG TPA: uroporphyrinogen-III synthase [Gammaproteobacteria bacterium]|nr:uroporphyrinogen-III synthase [Gammaproteobacteria bacterium]